MTDAPPSYLALDLWAALGGEPQAFHDYYARNGWSNTWATLLRAVRIQSGATRCGEYSREIEGPCVLLRHSDSSPHYGADDVGKSEPLPFVVMTPR